MPFLSLQSGSREFWFFQRSITHKYNCVIFGKERFNPARSSYDIALFVSSLRYSFADESGDHNPRDWCFRRKCNDCTSKGVQYCVTQGNHGKKAGRCLVANESREMEVCTFVMVVQQILAELVHLGADTWHDDFETRSVNEKSRSLVGIVVFKAHLSILKKHLDKIKTWSQLFSWIALSMAEKSLSSG